MYDMMLDAWENSVSHGLDKCTKCVLDFLVLLYFQDSDSDNERSQLTGETVTVFIEDDEGERRVLVHDDVAVSSDTIFIYSTVGIRL